MNARVRAPLGEAGFRRSAAHALSTPLGGLLLKVELVDHYLRHDKTGQARAAVADLLRDFESFGREFRSVFSAIADIAEDGDGTASPRQSLDDALSDLGTDAIDVAYRGASPALALPGRAMTALMRRLVMVATGRGARDAEMVGAQAGRELRIAMTCGTRMSLHSGGPAFEADLELHLSVAREIAARYGGRLEEGLDDDRLLRVFLPVAH